ncbi:hypothetical protein AB0M29_38845 [Streptomyces sp. NPDC051976]|uniref:hypothetical protein n=1 Tax=Streptomyces sp. NPDC051976 TaxID=3154947 RepID=UPI0034249329
MTEPSDQQPALPTLAQSDTLDVAVIPASVISSPKLSLSDLGLYVKLSHLMARRITRRSSRRSGQPASREAHRD